MLTLVQLLQYQIDYTIWATARLLNSATALSPDELNRDFGSADKSVSGTLLHIYRSERSWLHRIVSPPDIPLELPSLEWASVVEQWPALHQQWREFAQTLTDECVNTVLEYRTMKGEPRRNGLWVIILHVVNHGTHHRGQVSGFLRALGKTPPSLDSISYARELGI
ncbi:MAG TPA: DinB family protein [Rhizomicrobium sp.]|nr:DinB family protein [Rhizomicrobium sp.]